MGFSSDRNAKVGAEVVEETNAGKKNPIQQENQPVADLEEGKNSEPSTGHLEVQSPETTDGVEIIERTGDEVTNKTEKDAPSQNEEIFGEELDKGNLSNDGNYMKLADDTEIEPMGTAVSAGVGMVASEDSIINETANDQFKGDITQMDKGLHEVIDLNEDIDVPTRYAVVADQSLCIASAAENPTKEILQTGDLVNPQPVNSSFG